MRPPPGLNDLLQTHGHLRQLKGGGAGPLADLLADTRRRVEDIEHDQTQIKTEIKTQNENQNEIQNQIAAMEAKFALLEVQINAFVIGNQMRDEQHRSSFDMNNEMAEQITSMENRIIVLEAASNSASLSSSTAADYEVLKNPSLLKP